MAIDFSKVDLRTDAEKERDALCEQQGKEYLELLKTPGANKQRAINFLCKHYGCTEVTMRTHLEKAGVYVRGRKGVSHDPDRA